ncbi:MAG: polysulfide reductase NrfD [Chloroflexi bacterium]|nr:polysulfide reductase NrfD [Chloroflexota bacterium]
MVGQFTIGFKPQRLWTTLAAIDFFLGGTGAGAFLMAVYLGIGEGTTVGLVAVALGAIALLADLGRPERFWRAGSKVLVSWISRGVACTTVFMVFGVLYVVPDWVGGLPWSRGNFVGQGIGVIAAMGAVGVMMYTGFLLSHSPSIPFWNTTLLPLLFASSALASGAAALFVMLPVVDGRALDVKSMEVMGIGLLATNVVFLWVYVLNMYSSTIAAKASVRLLVRGNLAVPFLLGVTVVGQIIPLLLTTYAYLAGDVFATPRLLLPLAGVLALIGGYLFRRCMLKAGLYAPVL